MTTKKLQPIREKAEEAARWSERETERERKKERDRVRRERDANNGENNDKKLENTPRTPIGEIREDEKRLKGSLKPLGLRTKRFHFGF